ncbi:MAG: hypothetical protein NZM02_02235, partial [Patescibacteria group bacterium]|nr:hypothetical protein [Patescibacteria group bacterium]
MEKKNISVNIIIFIIFLFFNSFYVFASNKNKNNQSIKLDELKLTPIIASPTIIPQINITNNLSELIDDKNNKKQKNQNISYGKIINNLIYYTQYNNNYSLPNQDDKEKKCTIHYAGCGPTTSAMIIASYIDKSITPEKIVDYFKEKKYYLGCNGSSIYDNKSVIEAFGVKTSSDVMSFNL